MKKAILLVLASTFLMTSCGKVTQKQDSSKEESSKKSDTVKLTVWGEENNQEMLEQMFDSFKKKYANEANFDITFAVNADSDARDVILSDVHNAADVFHVPDDQIASLAAGGVLDAVPNADEIKAENVEGAGDALSVNGTLYAYPMTADNGYFMYYNKKYFKDEDLQTLDGMLSVAEKEKKKISMEWTSGWYMYAFFGNTGLDFGINEDGVTNHCNWNTKEGEITGVDVAKALIAIGKNPGFLNASDGEFIDNIKSGKVIAAVSGAWNAKEVKDVWGDDYGAVKLPTYTVAGKQVQMASFTGYKAIGVNYYCKEKEWAHKLAAWLTNEENQTLRFTMRNQGPSNIKAAESDAVKQVPAIAAVLDQSQYGTLQRVGNNYWGPFESFGNLMSSGNANNQNLQKVMDNLVKDITASTVN